MRFVYYMKKAAAVLLALSALALCACQPTPEQEIVVNKGGDILDAVKSQTPAETGNEGENAAVESENKLKNRSFPDHYSYEAKSENGLLTLMVDADVVLPASGKLPVATMEAAGFSQEMAKAMVRCLFPDGLPMDTQYIMTKADIEARILDYQREIETWRESDEEYTADAIAQYEEYIAELEAEYESAPEERPPATTTDGTYHTMSDGSLRLECSAQGRGHLFVLTGEAAHGAQIWYVNSTTNFTLDGAPEVDESFVPGKEYEGKLALPAADAIALAEGFLEVCGRDDIVLANIYIADDHGTGHVDDYYGPASMYAYKLFFTPTVNGTPVAVHARHGASAHDEYDIPWASEWIEFIVGDGGILDISWHEPGRVTEIVSEDADIIPFEEAVSRFEANIFQTYEPWCAEAENDYEENIHLNITVDEIRLGLIRVKQKDKPGQKLGVYVPAYLFYGTAMQTSTFKENGQEYSVYLNASSDLFTGPTLVIAINAIDGSVIDIMNSY